MPSDHEENNKVLHDQATLFELLHFWYNEVPICDHMRYLESQRDAQAYT